MTRDLNNGLPPADGMTVFFARGDEDVRDAVGGLGGGLGYAGISDGGFAVELDTWQGGTDPSGINTTGEGHVAVVVGGNVDEHAATSEPIQDFFRGVFSWPLKVNQDGEFPSQTLDLARNDADGLHVEVHFAQGRVQVWLSTVNDDPGLGQVFPRTKVVDGLLPEDTPLGVGYLGFSAATGDAVTRHEVDNVFIEIFPGTVTPGDNPDTPVLVTLEETTSIDVSTGRSGDSCDASCPEGGPADGITTYVEFYLDGLEEGSLVRLDVGSDDLVSPYVQVFTDDPCNGAAGCVAAGDGSVTFASDASPDGFIARITSSLGAQDLNVTLSRKVLLINEVDADTPNEADGDDQLEFIELFFPPGVTATLDGFSILLADGETETVYNAFDLDGQRTDEEGFFVLGNAELNRRAGTTVADMEFFGNDTLEDGQDGVILYLGNAADFPAGTPLERVLRSKICDVVVYSTAEGEFGGPFGGFSDLHRRLGTGYTLQEGARGRSQQHSLQRCPQTTPGTPQNQSTFLPEVPSAAADNNCDLQSVVIGPDTGGELAIATARGGGVVEVPAGAVSRALSIFVEDGGEVFDLVTDRGEGPVVQSLQIGPPGLELAVPAIVTLRWRDDDANGIVDGTTVDESRLVVARDGQVIDGDRDFARDEISIEVDGFSQFALVALSGITPSVGPFLRGDPNDDGDVDISDAISILGFLFLGSPTKLPCAAAADVQADGETDLSDALGVLNFAFLGGSPPAGPFPDCGRSELADDIAHGCDMTASGCE